MRKLLLIAALAGLSGCATEGAQQYQPANLNLSGFPPAYRAGYADGCDSAGMLMGRKRDAARFKSDPQYAQGWQDGNQLCKHR